MPYHVIDTCTGDLGGPAYRKYDLEAWMPGRGQGGEYGEVTSTSNCTDFQARRLGIRYKAAGQKGTRFVHTLNGTAVACTRAILAILVIYFVKLWRIALGMFSNPDDRRFVIGVLVAFLPAAVIGAAAGSYIKSYLFNPWVVCFSLIVGGAILMWVDQLDHKPHEHDATKFPLPMYLAIGFAQCLAMIPGVSRSGASIVAAMLLGADKRAAAEFSFFLAIPTMVGAFAYDFYKSRADMTMDHIGIIAIGFVVSFITAIIVVRTFLDYVTRHGFTFFAWWRVIVGTLGLVALAMGK